jgi:flagellar hook-associated protein 3 FlgL
MRVTPGLIGAQLTRDLHTALAALAKQQRMIASGRRINEPSDDPSGAASALTIRSRTAANEQYQRNIDTARRRLIAGDSALRGVVESLQRAGELALQGGNDASSAPARQAIATEVDQILEAVVAQANDRAPDGTRLFGGQEILAAPYTVTRDGTGKITAVAVNPRGIDAAMPAEVGEGVTVAQGVSGTTAFGALATASNAFDTLIRLRDALNANNGVNIRAEIDNVSIARERVTSAGLLVGTRLGWLDTLESRLQDDAVGLATSLSTVEDTDMAKAISDLNQIQLYYEAGLASGARLLQQSLLDFLR